MKFHRTLILIDIVSSSPRQKGLMSRSGMLLSVSWMLRPWHTFVAHPLDFRLSFHAVRTFRGSLLRFAIGHFRLNSAKCMCELWHGVSAPNVWHAMHHKCNTLVIDVHRYAFPLIYTAQYFQYPFGNLVYKNLLYTSVFMCRNRKFTLYAHLRNTYRDIIVESSQQVGNKTVTILGNVLFDHSSV